MRTWLPRCSSTLRCLKIPESPVTIQRFAEKGQFEACFGAAPFSPVFGICSYRLPLPPGEDQGLSIHCGQDLERSLFNVSIYL